MQFAGLVYKAMGFPTQYFTVLFAIPRVAGYLAHWKESLNDPDTKIIRPQQDYKVRKDGCSCFLLPIICSHVSSKLLKTAFSSNTSTGPY